MPRPLVWTHELIAKFWAYHAQFPQTYFSHAAGRDVVRRARPYIPHGARVLDYGCGPGFLLGSILDAGWQGAGCEMSDIAFGEYARKLATRGNCLGLFTLDRLKPGQFDAVFLCEVIEHLSDEALDQTFAAISSVLKPGGSLIITTPNNEDLAANTVYCPVSDLTFHRWQHERSWTASTLSAEIERRGLERVTVQEVGFNDAHSAWLINMLRRASYWIRGHPSLFAVARRPAR